jgi:foldase protein PrsA
MTPTRSLLRRPALLLALPLALSVAACGNDVPPNSVAKVDDSVIKRSEFDHWLGAAARGQQQAPGQPAAAVPDPPDYAECVATKSKQPVAKGSEKPSKADLKAQCRQQYDALKGQVMQFLVSANWIELEAKERGIESTDKTVRKQFQQQKKQSFTNDKQYREFLKASGQTEADLLFRVELDYLSNEIRKKVVAGKGKVSDQDIQRYYDKNKKRFAQPERRDLAVVLTRNKAQAERAKSALEDGGSFKQVARRFSIDDASKSQGGKLPGIAKGQQEKALDDAVFAAERGELTGPVKTQFGWYVFEVTKVTPATQQSMADSKETIRNLIKSEREQKALDSFVKQFRKKYKEETACAEGFEVAECKNAPEAKGKDKEKGQQPQEKE